MNDPVAEIVRKKRIQLALPVSEARLKNMVTIKTLNDSLQS